MRLSRFYKLDTVSLHCRQSAKIKVLLNIATFRLRDSFTKASWVEQNIILYRLTRKAVEWEEQTRRRLHGVKNSSVFSIFEESNWQVKAELIRDVLEVCAICTVSFLNKGLVNLNGWLVTFKRKQTNPKLGGTTSSNRSSARSISAKNLAK